MQSYKLSELLQMLIDTYENGRYMGLCGRISFIRDKNDVYLSEADEKRLIECLANIRPPMILRVLLGGDWTNYQYWFKPYWVYPRKIWINYYINKLKKVNL